MKSLPRPLAIVALLVLASLAAGCHLIFKYEDDPGTPDDLGRLDSFLLDGPAADRPLRDIKAVDGPRLDLTAGDVAKLDIAINDAIPGDLVPPPPDIGPPATWKVLKNNVHKDTLHGVYALSPGSIFAVGDKGKVLHWNGTASTNWKQRAPIPPYHPNEQLRAVHAMSSTEVVAVGHNNAIISCTALSCAQTNPFPNSKHNNKSWSDVWCANKNYCLLVGGTTGASKGYFLRTSTFSWPEICGQRSGSFLGDFVYGLTGHHLSGVRYTYAVGLAGRVIRYKPIDPCADISDSGMTNNLSDVWASPGGHLFAVGVKLTSTTGTLLHSKNPTSTSPTWDNPGKTLKVGLNGVWGTSNSDVWAVGNAGYITHWDGKNWTPQTLPAMSPTPNLHAVHGTGPKDVYVVGTGGAILHFN